MLIPKLWKSWKSLSELDIFSYFSINFEINHQFVIIQFFYFLFLSILKYLLKQNIKNAISISQNMNTINLYFEIIIKKFSPAFIFFWFQYWFLIEQVIGISQYDQTHFAKKSYKPYLFVGNFIKLNSFTFNQIMELDHQEENPNL